MIIFKKTALITGATSGIGKSFAKEYAKMGFDLIITGQISDKINIVAKELKEQYEVEIDVFIGDLSKDKNIDLLIEKIKNTRIDVLIRGITNIAAGNRKSGPLYWKFVNYLIISLLSFSN